MKKSVGTLFLTIQTVTKCKLKNRKQHKSLLFSNNPVLQDRFIIVLSPIFLFLDSGISEIHEIFLNFRLNGKGPYFWKARKCTVNKDTVPMNMNDVFDLSSSESLATFAHANNM